jgi:hypothetical protein
MLSGPNAVPSDAGGAVVNAATEPGKPAEGTKVQRAPKSGSKLNIQLTEALLSPGAMEALLERGRKCAVAPPRPGKESTALMAAVDAIRCWAASDLRFDLSFAELVVAAQAAGSHRTVKSRLAEAREMEFRGVLEAGTKDETERETAVDMTNDPGSDGGNGAETGARGPAQAVRRIVEEIEEEDEDEDAMFMRIAKHSERAFIDDGLSDEDEREQERQLLSPPPHDFDHDFEMLDALDRAETENAA